MTTCLRCDDTGFVCEAHTSLPWSGPRGCRCGAAGDPCPICNRALIEAETPAIDPAELEDVEDALAELAARHRRRH
ncbi:hypothetical protein [Bradyrhizobium sp. SRS-191]|uniref:hypothetical protein n=1 Tax=Bradyrhizobium sp. SRS-191 TaxID=2962606 RepID=UPI00211E59C8|nr:hypothetical protein [Bradyrhizobium sp. SRS-191]